ncbi:hypothetical protein B0H17DRAFT_1137163 [Mycena rosella]|uniref:Uncharacterized protein n=1 Tax=Mycena rosella TaxID=1033263 RepID=A0AAD7GB33_MYCRO|nr:hypothetical protein B0H17DRAFT_1137163 [Mycena rosella]
MIGILSFGGRCPQFSQYAAGRLQRPQEGGLSARGSSRGLPIKAVENGLGRGAGRWGRDYGRKKSIPKGNPMQCKGRSGWGGQAGRNQRAIRTISSRMVSRGWSTAANAGAPAKTTMNAPPIMHVGGTIMVQPYTSLPTDICASGFQKKMGGHAADGSTATRLDDAVANNRVEDHPNAEGTSAFGLACNTIYHARLQLDLHYPLRHQLKAKEANTRYCARNREDLHAAAAMRRAKCYIDEHGVQAYDEQSCRKYFSKTQLRHEGRAPPPRPKTLPIKLTEKQMHAAASANAADTDDGEEDEGDEDKEDKLPPARALFIGRALRIELPECAAGCDEVTCGNCSPRAPSIASLNPCSLLFLMSDYSALAPQHTHGAPNTSPCRCTPLYFPDPGYEDQARQDRFPDLDYYGIVHNPILGAVSSRQTAEAVLRLHPRADSFKAPTWAQFLVHWSAACAESHDPSGDAPNLQVNAAEVQVLIDGAKEAAGEALARVERSFAVLAELQERTNEQLTADAMQTAPPVDYPTLTSERQALIQDIARANRHLPFIDSIFATDRAILGEDLAVRRCQDITRTLQRAELWATLQHTLLLPTHHQTIDAMYLADCSILGDTEAASRSMRLSRMCASASATAQWAARGVVVIPDSDGDEENENEEEDIPPTACQQMITTLREYQAEQRCTKRAKHAVDAVEAAVEAATRGPLMYGVSGHPIVFHNRASAFKA